MGLKQTRVEAAGHPRVAVASCNCGGGVSGPVTCRHLVDVRQRLHVDPFPLPVRLRLLHVHDGPRPRRHHAALVPHLVVHGVYLRRRVFSTHAHTQREGEREIVRHTHTHRL